MDVTAGFADGDRHGWTDTWCSRLTRIMLGRVAAEHLASSPLPRRGAVVELPTWIWLPAAGRGRKGIARDGGSLLMPARVEWSVPNPGIVPDGQMVTLRWRSHGMEQQISGTTTVTAGHAGASFVDGEPPAGAVAVATEPAAALRRRLSDLSQDGAQAWWDALTSLEPFVERALTNGHAYLARDVHGRDGAPPVLDEVSLAQLRDHMLLGEEGDKASPVGRLIEGSLDAARFASVDPERYVMTALRRDAQEAIRRRIGDPHVGSRIRRVAQEIGSRDIGLVVAAYNDGRRSDLIGPDRAEKALGVTPPDAIVRAVPLGVC